MRVKPSTNATGPMEILLVEDNPDDIELTSRGLARSGTPHNLSIVEDGVSALRFLRREGPWESAPKPDLILLDLGLPKVNGHEVARAVKADPALADIPLAILTSSSEEQDIAKSLDRHADYFVQKSVGVRDLMQILGQDQGLCVLLGETKTPNLLIVDDNPDYLDLVQESLRDRLPDATITGAESIREARDIASHHRIDAILLDMGLPDSSGIDGLVRLREAAPDAAIVILTGYDDRRLRDEAMQSGAQGYIVKGPIDPEALVKTVREAVQQMIGTGESDAA